MENQNKNFQKTYSFSKPKKLNLKKQKFQSIANFVRPRKFNTCKNKMESDNSPKLKALKCQLNKLTKMLTSWFEI